VMNAQIKLYQRLLACLGRRCQPAVDVILPTCGSRLHEQHRACSMLAGIRTTERPSPCKMTSHHDDVNNIAANHTVHKRLTSWNVHPSAQVSVCLVVIGSQQMVYSWCAGSYPGCCLFQGDRFLLSVLSK